jgi:hypothetical protein
LFTGFTVGFGVWTTVDFVTLVFAPLVAGLLFFGLAGCFADWFTTTTGTLDGPEVFTGGAGAAAAAGAVFAGPLLLTVTAGPFVPAEAEFPAAGFFVLSVLPLFFAAPFVFVCWLAGLVFCCPAAIAARAVASIAI